MRINSVKVINPSPLIFPWRSEITDYKSFYNLITFSMFNLFTLFLYSKRKIRLFKKSVTTAALFNCSHDSIMSPGWVWRAMAKRDHCLERLGRELVDQPQVFKDKDRRSADILQNVTGARNVPEKYTSDRYGEKFLNLALDRPLAPCRS